MIASYLTSQLARQYLLLQATEFLRRHPHAWLAWEPGAWVAPSAKGETLDTRLPIAREDRGPGKGEALIFELNPKKTLLTLGRNADCDINISDGTVSRSHLALEFREQAWHVRLATAGPRASVSGSALDGQRWHRLESKQEISVGGVDLSYVAPGDLVERVKAVAATLSA